MSHCMKFPFSSFAGSVLKQNVLQIPKARAGGAVAMKQIIEEELQIIRDAGTWKHERIITSEQAASISVLGQSKKLLNFCANNYLGLSSHPAVVEAATNALKTHGAGLSSVRFICGTQDIHKELEAKIAHFHKKEDAILYASCYDANAGLFEVLLNKDDAVVSDALNHASVIDGIRLCKATKKIYKHIDINDLESQLQSIEGARIKMIATDGVFSMDGTVAPLQDITRLAQKYNAIIFLDECHSTGFFGHTGRGTEEHCHVEGHIDIINSTLGKALGGAAGGYTVGTKELTDLLRNRSRPYLFSNTLPPPVVASAAKVFDILEESSHLVEILEGNTHLFRTRMQEAGFTLSGDPQHPICPVMLGDAKLAAQFADKMLDKGIYVIGFSYPVVSKGMARIRVQLSAVHSHEDINRAVDAFIDIGRELNVIQ